MRLLFLGDVVGRTGRQAVISRLPELRERYKLDFVAVNAENAAGGFGITEAICTDLIDAGADVVTLGNHAFDQKEALVFIERQPRLIRPINYPPGTPGRGSGIFKAANGADVLVINAMGLVFMPELADPFRAVEAEVAACGLKQGADAILVDFHAEATSEKQALGYYLDGRVSLVVGTHTHAPTADERVLPEGTAFMSDVGMCGDYNSVLGMDRTEPLNRFLTKIPRTRMEPASGPATVAGVAVEVDDRTGLAIHVAGLRLGGVLAPTEPRFWVD
ncbi:MAG: TIGR00282 family metallophosphoesterase [Hyphomicrobiaceae bacterium]